MKTEKKKIASVITKWLVIAVSAACILSMVCTYILLYERTGKDAMELLVQNANDSILDVYQKASEMIFYRDVYPWGEKIPTADSADQYISEFETDEDTELSIIRNDGLITASSVQDVIGENVLENEGENFKGAAEMLNQYLDGVAGFSDIQKSATKIIKLSPGDVPKPSLDGKRELDYLEMNLEDWSGVILYGVSSDHYRGVCNAQSMDVATNRHIGQEGYLLVVYDDMMIIGGPGQEHFGEKFPYPDLLAPVMNDPSAEGEGIDRGQADFYGIPSYYAVAVIGDTFAVAVYPKSEAHQSMYRTLAYTLIMEIVVFAVLFAVIMILEKKLVINDIHKVNRTLNSITQGDLDAKADVRSTFEFDALSTDINATVDRLKEYIAEAAARIDEDLFVAKAIQTSVLPNRFPPFPDRHEFELFACMQAAKEVGGDFYDFYMLNDHTLGFLIADVSGKSIPGAMFMMRSKSVIKSLAESALPANEVFTEANEKLCEGNDAEMFLTAWMGYLELDTGTVHVANAGHNPPVLIRESRAKSIMLKPGLMLAGMDGTIYRDQTLQLLKGDILFLYTDGVTEAMNADEELYGMDRLLKLLSFGDNYPAPSGDNGIAGAVCEMVSADAERFAQGAEQSDDITMLCIRFMGR